MGDVQSAGMRITIIEDDDRVARGLVTVLAQAGFEVHRIATAAEAVRASPSDVVLVDLGLPDGDGLDVIRRLRDRPETAVIAVTARSEEHERVRGLRAGADDYIVKPFGVPELLARIDAVLRRTRVARSLSSPDEPLVLGILRIGVGTREVTVGGAPVTLTRKEFELLLLLARRAPNVVSRDVILDQIWGATWESSSRTLDTHIAALRHKLGPSVVIRTIHGVGYRLQADQPELIG
ncbi:DNA-binding response regulator, OmpR family, contains REC and winged-helix (wHTH) domain [Nonomuraea maritima]|uniref:DNA-binding response regulator, OmpR family, contains REC and winged-helix (WHTH) domain n=2 Tax=Nonomuraea maritima TaxID=683260 RepID=A0A1G9J6S3_9ACTN|nr:DNA-binding response regulator, OmpR family, contains REC and winged-helix (wHTH) domain [Nonomuraea maritima]